jgi:transposase-like protein
MNAIFRRDQTQRDEAERYKPSTAEDIQRAARDLADAGHSVSTISQILRIDAVAVHGMLGPQAPATPSEDNTRRVRTSEPSR